MARIRVGGKEDAVYVTNWAELIAALGGSGGSPVTLVDGADVAQGTTTDAAASSTVAEDATARTGISLFKGIKNILLLVKALLDVPSTPYNDRKTVAAPATAEVLAAAQALKSGVQIKAESDNTGIVYVGDASVSAANGYYLLSGETVFLPIDNLDEVWLDVSVAGDGVTYLAT